GGRGSGSRRGAAIAGRRSGRRRSRRRRLLHPPLLYLAGQGAAVHAEPARGLGDVVVGRGQRLVDVFPMQVIGRGLGAGERHTGGVVAAAGEGGLDDVGVRRLGQVLVCTELDRLPGGGDAGVAGEHHDQHIAVVFVQRVHGGQARSAGGELE